MFAMLQRKHELHASESKKQNIAISKKVDGANGEWQSAIGDCTTKMNFG